MAFNDHLTPVQGRVVVHCRLMSRVIVVGEKVEEVKSLIEPVDGVTGSSGPRSGFAVEKTRELLVLVTGLGDAVGLGVCEDDDAGGGLV